MGPYECQEVGVARKTAQVNGSDPGKVPKGQILSCASIYSYLFVKILPMLMETGFC